MSFRLVTACSLVAASALGLACNDDGQPCDPDQIVQDHLCIPAPKPEAGPPDVETADGETGDAENEDVVSEEPPGMFGRPCVMAGEGPECAPPAPYCAIPPSGVGGYCSAIGCKEDPTICPAGWGCLQVPGISVCTKPP